LVVFSFFSNTACIWLLLGLLSVLQPGAGFSSARRGGKWFKPTADDLLHQVLF